MNPILRPLLLLSFLIFLIPTARSQENFWELNNLSSINVDQLSDQQISAYYEYAVRSNMSEADLFQMAQQKGISQMQFARLKERLQQIAITRQTSATGTNVTQLTASGRREANAGNFISAEQPESVDSTVFGAEMFAKSSTVFEPNLRIATPSSYVLGPDDQVVINVFGLSEAKYELTVNEEGDIYIPNIGPLRVNGLTMEDAEILIRSKLAASIYSSMKTGRTRMNISLGKIKSIRVSVIGQAKKPGSYTVSSLTTLFNMLFLSGGPSINGSFRNIEIIRNNKVFKTADLYRFILKGDQSDNIMLKEGDVVRIPYFRDRVIISGNIRRPGKFEMTEQESMQDLLDYCGGFDALAYRKNITLFRIDDGGISTIDLDNHEYSSFKMKNGDNVIIRPVKEIFTNRVAIFGSVHLPGYYELSGGMTLSALITKAGGLLPDAHLGSASVFRFAENQIPIVVSVNIDSILKGLSTTTLLKNDSIFINSLFDFRDSLFVNVDGYVNRPTQVSWRENMSLFDAVMEAGGIRTPGDSGRIEISRKINAADVSQANHIETETIFYSLHDNIQLKPYDYIFVRNAAGFVNPRAVAITGEVKYPGKYILEKSSERLSDIISRSGGFKASADSVSITIRRKSTTSLNRAERERIFQRLLDINPDSITENQELRAELFKSYELVSIKSFDASGNYTDADNLILDDGDIITVEKNNNLVKISGEVYFPTIITFDKNKGAKYYLKQAGNFTSNSNKKAVMVIYPDGRAKSVKKFLFFKNYPAITSRSEIFVPKKSEREKNKASYAELALIVTSMGILANLIIALFK